jgi:hypothetical protein
MARKNEAEKLLRNGLCPSEIARRMGISLKSVIQYLRTQVGEGSLRLTDLYFSWPPQKREILQKAGRGRYPDEYLLSANGLCRDDLELFQSLRSPRVFSGDLYEYVSLAEVAIHRLVRDRLKREFGPEEDGWWRKGIPSRIRMTCASRREEDDDPCEEPYAYTTLIDLVTVISKSWGLFETEVPKDYRVNRKQLESDLVRLNRIRNSVMHPVKERKWSEDDFVFVRRMCDLFGSVEAS